MENNASASQEGSGADASQQAQSQDHISLKVVDQVIFLGVLPYRKTNEPGRIQMKSTSRSKDKPPCES